VRLAGTRSLWRHPRLARISRSSLLRCMVFALVAVLIGSRTQAEVHRVPIDGFEKALRHHLAMAKPGDEIVLPKGRFELAQGLVLAVNGVSVRGQGKEATVLDFSNQKDGGQAWLVLSDDVAISQLGLENAPADGLVARDVQGFDVTEVSVVWNEPSSKSRSGYGIYPVLVKDVRIENCYARGASEAGIYVGQSADGVIVGNTVEGNVVGLDIENSIRIRVERNNVRDNSIGVLVAARPGLVTKSSSEVRVSENEIRSNNLTNFAAEGSFHSLFGEGKGIAVVGTSATQLEANLIADHSSTHILLLSYNSLGLPKRRAIAFSPDLRHVVIARNRLERQSPARMAPASDWRRAHGMDVVWDGLASTIRTRATGLPPALCRRAQAATAFLVAMAGRIDESFETAIPECRQSGSQL
jgi:parallel beta-helix repeat protein